MSDTPARQRMIETAVRLFQRHGYHATSWRTLVDEAGTPWGSAHHYFPGGKEQLGVAAIELGAAGVVAHIEALFAQHRVPAAAVRAWCRNSADRLAASGYLEGCPIATITLETSAESESLATATRLAFDRWHETITRHLADSGIKRKRAQSLAMLILISMEGALLLSRAARSKDPLLLAGDHLAEVLVSELDE